MARIMITDDSDIMRLLLKEFLTRLGHIIVGEANNGEEAVWKCQELKPDLITMDITMPIMNGIEALKKIKEWNVDTKVVMFSALAQPKVIQEAMQLGANGFIEKPFDMIEIKAAIEQALNE